MPTYKLSYFDAPGRGEVPRMLFTLAGQEFQDIRIKKEDWPQLKPKTPMGALPILEIDDVMICQSNAISRYVARKFGFGGKTEMDQVRVDMIIDCTEDILKSFMESRYEKTEEDKMLFVKKYQDEVFPNYMQKMENILKQNNHSEGWFVGDDITWADVQFMVLVNFLGNTFKTNMDKYEGLSKLVQKTQSHSKILEWLSKRPK